MGGKSYYGPAIAGLGVGFFIGFLLVGEGVIPYNLVTKSIVLVCALALAAAGQILARSVKPQEPPKAT